MKRRKTIEAVVTHNLLKNHLDRFLTENPRICHELVYQYQIIYLLYHCNDMIVKNIYDEGHYNEQSKISIDGDVCSIAVTFVRKRPLTLLC